MSSHPSLRHLYDFSGWVIQEVQVTPEIAVVKLHRDRRRSIYCPHCIKKAVLNKKVMQMHLICPLAPSVWCRSSTKPCKGIAVAARVILPCIRRELTVMPMQPGGLCTMCADCVGLCRQTRSLFFCPSPQAQPGDGINGY